MANKTDKPISIIVAIADNMAIGKNNDLLFHLPNDLKRFKEITTGHTVIMGKRTYESLPRRPLPNRENMVISDVPNDKIEGCTMAYSIEDAVEKCSSDSESFIIGGGMVYKQFLPIANKLYLTFVHKEFDADVFFPEINFDEWIEEEREDIPFNEELGFSYSYVNYVRKSSQAQ